MPTKIWCGSTIKNCDLCKKEIKDQFVDGVTDFGPWAIMCMKCFLEYGIGLGVGRGQKYKYSVDGDKWENIE